MSNLETPLEIGTVTLHYNEQGKLIEEDFQPAIAMQFNRGNLLDLKNIASSDDSEVIRKNAENIIAQWFSRINDIDLADHFEYGFVSETVSCEKHPSGQVKKCGIKFSFKKFQ